MELTSVFPICCQIKTNMTIWIARQNPLQKTVQQDMWAFININKIITCPYGHVQEASTYVDRNEFGVYNENGATARDQDRRFVDEMQPNDIVIILFSGMDRVMIARVESDSRPSRNFSSMLVVKRGADIVTVTSDVGQYQTSEYVIEHFRPVYRNIRILARIPYPQDVNIHRRHSLSIARSPDVHHWVQQVVDN